MRKTNRLLCFALCLLLAAALFPSAPAKADSGIPEIIYGPQSYSWPAGSDASYTCFAWMDEEATMYKYDWYLVYEGKTYCLSEDLSVEYPWIGFGDFGMPPRCTVNGPTITIPKIQKGLSGAYIYCVASNFYDPSLQAISNIAVISVGDAWMKMPPREISVRSEVRCTVGDAVTLNVEASHFDPTEPAFKYIWYESPDGMPDTIRAIGDGQYTSSSYKPDTSRVGTRYYCCLVLNDGENPNYSYSGIIAVRVEGEYEQPDIVDMEILSQPDKLHYTVGDSVDLTGLRIRIWTGEGFRDVENGQGMDHYPDVLTEEGKNVITVTYEGFTVSFNVTASSPAEGQESDVELHFTATVSENPQSYCWNAGDDAYYSAYAACSNPDISLYPEWYLEMNGVTYCLSDRDLSEPWAKYVDPASGPFGVGPIDCSLFLGGIQPGLEGSLLYAEFTQSDGSKVRTEKAVILVSETKVDSHAVIIAPPSAELTAGETVSVTAYDENGSRPVSCRWFYCDDGTLFTIRAVMDDADKAEFMPRTSGCYVCEVTLGTNVSYSSAIRVTVTGSFPAEESVQESAEESKESAAESSIESNAESDTVFESSTESKTESGQESSGGNAQAPNTKLVLLAVAGGLLIAGLIAALVVLLKRK